MVLTDDLQSLKIACHNCSQRLDMSALAPFSTVNCPNCGTLLTVPQWFSTYLLEDVIKSNNVASTYRALDVKLDREVAIKVLTPELAQDKNLSEIFLREARSTARLNHPGIVSIYLCGEFENRPFLVMQYMQRGGVDEILKTKIQISFVDAVKWLYQITRALREAYNEGITHGEITPQNILLDSQNDARIGAFGINRALTMAGVDCGIDEQYCSPESRNDIAVDDYRADVYSLGIVMYEMFTGSLPDDKPKFADARISRVLRRVIPEPLAKLIVQMLNHSSNARPDYQTIIETLKSCRDAKPGENSFWQKIFANK
ncbi:MAG: serine/threonine-protein kinase [Victivallaceae bacterium]|nr:serine/threonine-protein kinase [Victivallaceae bacterium]